MKPPEAGKFAFLLETDEKLGILLSAVEKEALKGLWLEQSALDFRVATVKADILAAHKAPAGATLRIHDLQAGLAEVVEPPKSEVPA